MPAIPFTVNTTNKGLWRTLANNEYEDSMQPITEIIDNSLAAESTVIKITVNFETHRGSIEDNGKGFPITPEELSRCFTYSPDTRVQTNLNEHGCGLKSSLAILDPQDETWRITWKNKKMYQVSAPYSSISHTAVEINDWPGTILDKTGTFIEFPIKKSQFNVLYSKKTAAMTDENVIIKLKEELSQYWMKYTPFSSGNVKIYLNDKLVSPFIFPHDDTNYITSIKNYNKILEGGGILDITHYVIVKHIPSSWFKCAEISTGVYLFKNGRLIQKITNGSLYKKILGTEVHNHYNGNIAIINMTGKQSQLPITVPTKNKFKPSNNPIFDEVISILQKEIKFKLTVAHSESEEQLLSKFEKMRLGGCGSDEDRDYKFLLKEQLTLKDDNLNSPQLDALEIIDKKANVYEAKRENKPALSHIIQVYCNWILSKDAIKESYPNIEKVVPILLINTDVKSCSIAENMKTKIKKLAENSKHGFPFEIRNYENSLIYKFK
jgi:hypothetical protein